ncbi:MAG TPA: SDR family oxidoreductase [Ktedonobacteraceae bacterium]|nr:SDR family oxidoreductase [Ktedonobacteraceae bacterium]
MPQHPPFKENVVLVTGASQGIGEQLAYQLAEQGAWLALVARNAERLETVAATCRTLGGRAIAVPTDLTDETQCQQCIERTVAEYGRIDTLLNNAGRGYPKPFAQLADLHTVRAEIDLNYLGTVYCTCYALPYLKRTRGRIVGVNSFGGRIGIPGTGTYNASKHAMRGFLDSLRVELRSTGVTVSIAYLGAIRTERLREVMGSNVERVPTMDPKRCATLILRQAARRERQQIMTASGKFLVWLNNWSPALVERILASIPAVSSPD